MSSSSFLLRYSLVFNRFPSPLYIGSGLGDLQKIILKRSFSAKDHSQDPAKDHSQDFPQVENFGHKLKSDQNFGLRPPFPFSFNIIICKLMLATRVASNRNTSFKVKLCTQQQQTPKGRGCCS